MGRKKQHPDYYKIAQGEIFHILLKVRSDNGRTILEHKRVVNENGVALLGKFGSPISKNFQAALNAQIQRGTKTFLFLMTLDRAGKERSYSTHGCELLRVHDGLLDNTKESLVPSYYRADMSSVGSWFEISSLKLLSQEETNKLYVLSSGREIMSAIKGMASVFRVGLR